MNVRTNNQAKQKSPESAPGVRLHGTPSEIRLDETPEQREARIARTIAGLDELKRGDPEEHRETLEFLLRALGDEELLGETSDTTT